MSRRNYLVILRISCNATVNAGNEIKASFRKFFLSVIYDKIEHFSCVHYSTTHQIVWRENSRDRHSYDEECIAHSNLTDTSSDGRHFGINAEGYSYNTVGR